MTKREICERLINIHNRLFHEYAMADGMEDIDVEEIGKDIGYLILDLAAPEEEPKHETPEAEKKRTVWDDWVKGLSEHLAAEWLKTPNAEPDRGEGEK